MLLRPRAILRPYNKPGVLVRIPQLSPAETLAWQQRLDPLAQECGCNAGTVGVGVFLVLAVLAALFANIPGDVRLPWQTGMIDYACFVGGLILSAVLGKLFGQTVAALRLQRACFELEEQLNLRPAAPHNSIAPSHEWNAG